MIRSENDITENQWQDNGVYSYRIYNRLLLNILYVISQKYGRRL